MGNSKFMGFDLVVISKLNVDLLLDGEDLVPVFG